VSGSTSNFVGRDRHHSVKGSHGCFSRDVIDLEDASRPDPGEVTDSFPEERSGYNVEKETNKIFQELREKKGGLSYPGGGGRLIMNETTSNNFEEEGLN